MRVTIDVSQSCVVVSWDGGEHRVSPASLARLREVGRGALVLTCAYDEQDAKLREAGTVLWPCTLGEAAVPFEVGQAMEVEIRSSPGLGAPLADVPWECMIEPRLEVPLAYHPHFAIFRQSGPDGEEEPAEDEGTRLRVLILVPDTRDLPPLRSADEINALRESLDALDGAGVAEIKILRPGQATLRQAREELVRRQPHVLHYIGHSQASADAGGTSRFLFDGREDFVPERAFLSLLLDLPSPPRLLVLNSCHSAGPLLSAGLPAKLRRFGIRAVVAMRSPVSDRLAVDFASCLYRELTRGASIGASCQAGRRRLARAAPAQGHWALPILYTNQPTARLLHVATPDESAASAVRITFQEASRIPLKGLNPYSEDEEDLFFGRTRDVERTLNLLYERGALVLHGEHGVGKTSLIRAGLAPALRRAGFRPLVGSRWPILARELLERLGVPEPAEEARERLSVALDAHPGRVALLLDQAEDALESAEGWKVLLSLLSRSGRDALLLLVVRADALPALRERLSTGVQAPLAELALPPLTRSGARHVLAQLRHHSGLEVDAGLEEIWLAEGGDDPEGDRDMVLPLFSLVLTRLARSLPPAARPVLGPPLLESLGGIRGILADWMRETIDAFGEKEAEAARRVLVRLVDRAAERAAIRSKAELAGSLPRPRLEAVLTGLTRSHLVRILPDGCLVLAHPALAAEILERCRSTDEAWRRSLRARISQDLGLSLDPGWIEPEHLDEIDPRGLSEEELAVWIGWSLLRPAPLSTEIVAGVPDGRLQRAFRLLWKSASADFLARALAFAARMPPHRRGASPLTLAAGPAQEAEARFACEAMLPEIARRVSEDHASKEDRQRSILSRLLVQEVLFEGRPLNDRWTYPRARDLGFFDQESVLAGVPRPAWPGPWPAPALFVGTVAAVTPLLAWLAWPGRSLPLAHLPNVLLLSLAALATGWYSGCTLAADRLSFPSAGHREEFSRVLWRLRNLIQPVKIGTMFPAILLTYGWAVFSLVNGLHTTLLAPSWLWEPFAAILSRWQDGSLGTTAALWDLGKLLLTPLWAMLGLMGYLAVVVGVLAPPALAVASGQLAAGRSLLWRKSTGVLRCIAVLAAIAAVGAMALPLAFRIGADLLAWLQPFVPRPDLFLGPRGLEAMVVDWRALSISPGTAMFGAVAPLLGALLAGAMPDRRTRLAHSVLTLFWLPTTDQERLRPLVAEGTPQAFAFACQLIRKSPDLRGPESLSLLVSLAAGSDGLLAAGTPEEREDLAREALAAIRSFDPAAPAVRGQLAEIAVRLAGAGDDERRALESVREILESLPPQGPEKRRWMRIYLATVTFVLRGLGWRQTGPELSDGRWVWSAGAERRADVPRAAATTLLLLAAAVGLLHTVLFAGGALFDLLFPLAEPAGAPFLDPSRTLSLLTRLAELVAVGLLSFGAIRLWKLLRGGRTSKENGA